MTARTPHAPLLTCAQMQAAEERLFATGVEAEPLMDRAGLGIARVVCQFFAVPGTVVAFIGKGHNGGDALVACRHLAEDGWRVHYRYHGDPRELRPLSAKKLEQLGDSARPWSAALAAASPHPLVLLDGLLGIGATGNPRGSIADAITELNALRLAGGTTFAVDIPSGLDGDTGQPAETAVVADVTVTIAHPKAGLVADAAINHVGRLALVPLDDIAPLPGELDAGADVLFPRGLAGRLPRRAFDTHKGMAGRVGIIAGSRGLTGAAVLAASAAVRGGAGLVTLFAAEDIYPILASACPPEVMVKPVADLAPVTDFQLDALAIGPGLGSEPAHADAILDLVLNDPRPAVIDADALNLIARENRLADLANLAATRLLTPHPGELARLLEGTELPTGDRRATAEAFAAAYPATLLYKGARTIIAERGQPVAFNTTGHPGMATGGVGDILTGLSAALVAQGASAYDAACLASWVVGRAAEFALQHGQSPESFQATDILTHLGAAFSELNR